MLLGVVGARECHAVLPLPHRDRIVDLRLNGEGQQVDAFMSQILDVVRNRLLTHSEHHIEQLRRLDVEVVVGGILLVPEHRGNARSRKRCDHRAEHIRWPFLFRHLTHPCIVLPPPGGLDEEHRRLTGEHLRPVRRGDLFGMELVLEQVV